MKKFKILVTGLVTFAFFAIYSILTHINAALGLFLFLVIAAILSWLLVEVCARISEDDLKDYAEMEEEDLEIAIELVESRVARNLKAQLADHKLVTKLKDLLFEKRGHTRTAFFNQ